MIPSKSINLIFKFNLIKNDSYLNYLYICMIIQIRNLMSKNIRMFSNRSSLVTHSVCSYLMMKAKVLFLCFPFFWKVLPFLAA